MSRHGITTIIAAVCLTFFSSGCERLMNLTGSKVSFVAGTSTDSHQTKTSYGSYSGTSGSRVQEIGWTLKDTIKVYCDQCQGTKSAEYKVTELTGTSTARIDNVGTSGLIWGTGTHTFYAVYPSTATISANKVSGNIPASQSFTGVADKVVSPDMTNLYMTAKTQVAAEGAASGDAFLNFQTLSTVLQFTIVNKFESESAMKVSTVSLISQDFALSGDFTADLDVTTGTYYDRPDVTIPSGGTTSKQVSLDLSSNDVQVAYGDSLTFTFFLNPGNENEVNDITFKIEGKKSDDSSFTRSAKIAYKSSGTGYTFQTHKKTNVRGLMVPETIEWSVQGNVNPLTNEDSSW